METTISVNQIIKDIEGLDYSGKLNILSHLVNMLKKTDIVQPQPKLTDLKGLGKELWQNIDIDNYISKERDAWS